MVESSLHPEQTVRGRVMSEHAVDADTPVEIPRQRVRPAPRPVPGDDHTAVSGPPALDVVRAALLDGARAYFFPPTTARVAAEARARSAGHPGSAGPGAPGESTVGMVEVASAAGAPTHLTQREVEIIQRVADGFTNKQIADALGLSALTVKSHLARVSHRLRAGDRAHLVLLALRAGAIA